MSNICDICKNALPEKDGKCECCGCDSKDVLYATRKQKAEMREAAQKKWVNHTNQNTTPVASPPSTMPTVAGMVQTEDGDWLNGERPGPQKAYAGKQWQYRLPLADPNHRVEWSSDLPDSLADIVSSTKGLDLNIMFPDDISGYYKLAYYIEGQDTLNGEFYLMIHAASRTHEQDEQHSLDTDPDVLMTSNDDHADNIAESLSPDLGPKLSRSDRIHIKVFREDTLIPQLETRLEQDKTILVGKRSDSKNIYPDLNLKGNFPSSAMENLCSREQAHIFYSRGRVYIRNLGKAPLKLAGQDIIHSGLEACWPPGTYIELPGNIRLLLVVE